MTNNKNKLQKVLNALSSAYTDSGLGLDVALVETLLEDVLASGISFLELAIEYLQENNDHVEESPDEEDYQPSSRDAKLDTYHTTSTKSFIDKLEEDLYSTFFGITNKDYKGND